MDRYVQRFIHRIALLLSLVASVSLLHLFHHSTLSCTPTPTPTHPQHVTLTLSPLPRSSCDSLSRSLLPPDRRFLKLRSSPAFLRRLNDFTLIFDRLRSISLLSNSSHVLSVFSGAGHDAAALTASGVADVTAVDLVDFPPLVSRADPHNLPFFDSVFDLGFSAGIDGALFPARFVAEMERTVRKGGAEVIAVGGGVGEEEVEGIKGLFRRSTFVGMSNVTIGGAGMLLIMMKNNGGTE